MKMTCHSMAIIEVKKDFFVDWFHLLKWFFFFNIRFIEDDNKHIIQW